ncbi:MAG: GNAT family N-acetyltransferase [Pseudomonadota bacterium]
MNIHLGYLPGCIGRITELHAEFYAAATGFGVDFEAKVAKELSDFCLSYVEGRDGLWLVMDGARIEGSMAIDASHSAEHGAHLRWFITSDQTRGTGMGQQLLAAAMAFCASKGYRKVYLWTFDELPAARHLYEKHGFRVVRTQRGSQWGREVNEQLYERTDV